MQSTSDPEITGPLQTQTSSALLSVAPSTSDAFHCMIIDNNLFRPLGYRLPRPEEPYRLTGTLTPTDGNTFQKCSFREHYEHNLPYFLHEPRTPSLARLHSEALPMPSHGEIAIINPNNI
ncbi:hypothetical protein F4009_21235 [Candidatus Poribacteria bacterium]|nr:hypothetical protein [Candidatus Poribacteria bacterium]MYK96487.1 hypothetical protein [Candidatus Poribacteria bacterium]